MLIENKYPTTQCLKDLKGPWKDIALIFQDLCTTDRRMNDNRIKIERIKIESLPITTFLNAVSHIVGIINNEFGDIEVRGLYEALDPVIPHDNIKPDPSVPQYEYCCNRLYERTVIFAGVYYIIAIENPELRKLLFTIHSQADYEEGAPYFNQFTFNLKNKSNGSSTLDNDFIPPYIIPEFNALMKGYREFKPATRLGKFRAITNAIEAIPQDCRSVRINTLYLVVMCAIKYLKRTYCIDEDAFTPDNEKVAISSLLDEFNCTKNENKNAIADFLERVIKSKELAAQDQTYLDLLNKGRPTIIVTEKVEIHQNDAPINAYDNCKLY